MAGDGFSPEYTARLIERDVLRLRCLGAVLLYSPQASSELLKVWPDVARLSTGDGYRLYLAARKAAGLDELAEQWQDLGGGHGIEGLVKWAWSVNLPYPWMVAAALLVLSRVPQRAEKNALRPALLATVAQVQGRVMALPAVHTPPTTVAGFLGPVLPTFRPAQMSEAAYRAQCALILDEYILREKLAHRKMGLQQPEDAPAEAEHLRWLVARLVGKKSWRKIAQTDADGRVQHTAVQSGVLKMADRLGVQLRTGR